MTGDPLAVLLGHGDDVNSALFNFDGQRVVTASDDTTARVWNVDFPEQTAVLSGHSRGVNYASFSPDGSLVATLRPQMEQLGSGHGDQ